MIVSTQYHVIFIYYKILAPKLLGNRNQNIGNTLRLKAVLIPIIAITPSVVWCEFYRILQIGITKHIMVHRKMSGVRPGSTLKRDIRILSAVRFLIKPFFLHSPWVRVNSLDIHCTPCLNATCICLGLVSIFTSLIIFRVRRNVTYFCWGLHYWEPRVVRQSNTQITSPILFIGLL